ncbi:multicopper oxidase domain-containing protein [Aromatoleum toluclasticum]|uniref:multicopper oxidase family protein n=1 Tax=Aromatoleum toluclasticum TaxID=92003 RepID=UPI001D196A6D|nr:multicopper oxidase domain-containing protein [Aromatoleum toluclasticum]MCC4116243.1 multicopper oxidase domain-containing protein [Aromatoleum toluclasticum]
MTNGKVRAVQLLKQAANFNLHGRPRVDSWRSEMFTRRSFLKTCALAGSGIALPLHPFLRTAHAYALLSGAGALSDPALQFKFVESAPNALDPAFLFKDLNSNGRPVQAPNFSLRARETVQETGLVDPHSGRRLKTKVWGYGADTVSWPGQTFQVMSASAGGAAETVVRWENELQGRKHLLPVDTSTHWCYSLHGDSSVNGVDYRQFSIERDGVPIITHLHGGHSDYQFDGNPEFFYSPDGKVKGPQWDFAPDGFTNTFRYDNRVRAGSLWYHDHALGITRLNVYAGLAGFYFVRDEWDTGLPRNPLGLPAFPYELAYAVQDRMFTRRGELFYPAFPGDPFYEDFIDGEDAELPSELFPHGGPTALAEFFGDHIVVNGKIWPKADVEPRHYRLRLLNGSDSRFLILRFRVAASLAATNLEGAGSPLPFYVIGADQGLASQANMIDRLVFEPGGRYDVVIDFADLAGQRIIMENIGADAPFGGDFGEPFDPDDVFPDRQTDRIMAFDVTMSFDQAVPDSFDVHAFNDSAGELGFGTQVGEPTATRKVALFEGKDEFGRLQPLLGVVNADATATAFTWFQPPTETPALDVTEMWEIHNFTGDAHPVHLHLVNFEVVGRNEIEFAEGEPLSVLQHNGALGAVAAISDISVGAAVSLGPNEGYVENAPKDVVTALPGQVTRIKASFDKRGRYVWHCHILSHEDHEMMRVLGVD